MAAEMLIIEGLIGVGKTTLSDNLGKELNYRVMHGSVDDNPYLEKFYQDPKRYALEMQFWLMSRRFAMHREAIEHIWSTGQGVIMDRSIYGDAIFAKKNFQDGNIDETGYSNYLAMRDVMFRHLMVPQICLYLAADVNICQTRIAGRQRTCESNIPTEYLLGLNKLYQNLLEELRAKGSRVLTIDWNTFKDTSEVLIELRENGVISEKSFSDFPYIKSDSTEKKN